MMRVFGHHIALPVLLLAGLEAGVLVVLFEGLTSLFGLIWPGTPEFGVVDGSPGGGAAAPFTWGGHGVPRGCWRCWASS